jgi:amino acid transporter
VVPIILLALVVLVVLVALVVLVILVLVALVVLAPINPKTAHQSTLTLSLAFGSKLGWVDMGSYGLILGASRCAFDSGRDYTMDSTK